MTDTYDTAHLDGYRVTLEQLESGAATLCRIELAIKYNGQPVKVANLMPPQSIPTTDVPDHLARLGRTTKCYAAMTRFLNEGGTLTELRSMAACLDAVLLQNQLLMQAEPVCVESEETHARTFRLPDGRFLRIVEDAFSEVMTTEEMAMAMQADRRGSGDSGLDFNP